MISLSEYTVAELTADLFKQTDHGIHTHCQGSCGHHSRGGYVCRRCLDIELQSRGFDLAKVEPEIFMRRAGGDICRRPLSQVTCPHCHDTAMSFRLNERDVCSCGATWAAGRATGIGEPGDNK